MSPENPTQIDLSQENSWNSVDSSLLSLEEKAMLNEKFKQETDGILYLSQQELSELKNILEWEGLNSLSQNIQNGTIEWDVSMFIQNQKNEGLSLSDFNPENIKYAAMIEHLEATAQNKLFWVDWVFSWLDISSETAQQSMSISFVLALLEKLNSQDTITQEVLQNTDDFIQWAIENLGELKKLSETMTAGGPGGEQNRLHINWNWENNTIFMNPDEWKDFFLQILNWAQTQESLEAQLEAANTEAKIEVNMDAIQQILKQNTDAFNDKLGVNIVDLSTEDQATLVDNLETWTQEEHWLAKMIKEFIAWILKFGEDMGFSKKSSDGEIAQWEDIKAPEEVAPTSIELHRKMILDRLSQSSLSGIDTASIEDYLSDDVHTQSIMNIIQEIPDNGNENTAEKKLNNVLRGVTQNWDFKLTNFISTNELWDIKNSDNTLNSQNLLWALTQYKEYRKDFQNNRALTFEQYNTNKTA